MQKIKQIFSIIFIYKFVNEHGYRPKHVPMEKTLNLIGNNGLTFLNAFVNTPICCPSRSTILTGKYLHNTGVRNNSVSGNCSSHDWQKFHEPYSIAAILKNEKQYNTFYAGKYLNQYGSEQSNGISHVPKGYDWWIGLEGNSKYYNYTLSINGTRKYFEKDYLTDLINDYALDFLKEHHVSKEPFFMTLAPPAAHSPFTPAPRHAEAFSDVKAVRTPSFNYTPIDKHWLLQLPPLNLPENVTILDEIQRNRLRTLLAVDEMVENVYNTLKSLGLMERTYFIFTSDHGYHIGQFGQPWDKRQPYETDVRVPFLISGPNIPRKTISSQPISFVDLAPTILDLAQVNVPTDMDGGSYKEYLFDPSLKPADKLILIEYHGEGHANSVDESCLLTPAHDFNQCSKSNWCKCQDVRNNTFECIRHISASDDFKFCQFMDSENYMEAYDLQIDRFELTNIYQKMELSTITLYKHILEEASLCRGALCQSSLRMNRSILETGLQK